MKKMIIYGTRPDCIKLAPLMNLLKDDCIVVNTGQHAELPTDVLQHFNIQDTYNLKLMTHNQSLESFVAKGLVDLTQIIKNEAPGIVIVQGDTSTAMIGALAASYNQSKIAHVEAGMRTYRKFSPFPEEINRTIIDSLVDYAFCPDQKATENITNRHAQAYITGNTSSDALFSMAKISLVSPYSFPYVLVTSHRRESHGEPLDRIVKALLVLADIISEKIVFIVHPNPNVQRAALSLRHDNIILKTPLSYSEMIAHIDHASLVITDSGGLQEEAPALNKRVVYLRNETELPQLASWVTLVGTDEKRIIDVVRGHLRDKSIPLPLIYDTITPSMKIAEILKSL